MPGVLLQPAPFIDSRSGRTAESLRYFFVILTVTFRDRRKVRGTQQAPSPVFHFEGGGPGIVYWEGRKADAIGIGPVHSERRGVDGGQTKARRYGPSAPRR